MVTPANSTDTPDLQALLPGARLNLSPAVPYPPIYRTVLAWVSVFELNAFDFSL